MAGFAWTRDGLTEALAALGATPGEVADTLLAGGHRGKPECETSCPVADYLGELYPDAFVAVVAEPPECVLVAELYAEGRDTVEVPLPGPVALFVTRFDSGDHYRELDRTFDLAGAS